MSTLLILATLVSFALGTYISFTSQAMLFVLIVAIAAYLLDRWQSVTGAVFSVLLLNFFFVPPTWTFHIEHPEHLIALGTMLIVALTINQLTANLKQKTVQALQNEQRARQLQELAIGLALSETVGGIQELGKRAFEQAFQAKCYLVLSNLAPTAQQLESLSQQQIDGLHHCMKEMQVLGAGSLRWGELNDWYIPIGNKKVGIGAALIQAKASDDHDNQAHAQAICSLLTQAFERLRFNLQMQSAQNEAQKQQLQSTFLAAISHDLRTPLAVMVGAASALRSQGDNFSQAQQAHMLQSIVDEANYLTSVTENTLQLVRLSETGSQLHRDWESIEEIVGAVLARIKQGRIETRLQANIENDLPLLRLDPVLIAQLLSNLIDNALKYSEGIVELEVKVDQHLVPPTLHIAVMDHGPGIPTAEHNSIFEAYSRLAKHDQANQRSAGLGLAVCRAIAIAHEGQLIVNDREGGGSCFVLSLPIPQSPFIHPENGGALP
ncbi:ATP-binding protein [Undibacterium fentianense]|uniref:ATP-binding protein n=1 Tax=Undibacterium fentianense TaxID=2828728 RepID=UPI001E2CE20A|nr:ATP-binding protein [Undibacterium fentianense]